MATSHSADCTATLKTKHRHYNHYNKFKGNINISRRFSLYSF